MIEIYTSLCELYPFYKYPVISLIGGGGKTSLLFSLGFDMKPYHSHICLSTTTHMMYPSEVEKENILLQNDEKQLKSMLHTNEITYVASLYNKKKLQKPSDNLIRIMEQEANIVIYEADGSKMLPIKCIGAHEPAVLDSTQLCIQVIGYSCMHKPLSQVCHRYELACSMWGWKANDTVDIHKLIQLAKYNFTHVKTKEKLLLINQIDLHITIDDINIIQKHFPNIPVLFVSLNEKMVFSSHL